MSAEFLSPDQISDGTRVRAKIVFRVVPTQCDDDFVIFPIYPGLGAAGLTGARELFRDLQARLGQWVDACAGYYVSLTANLRRVGKGVRLVIGNGAAKAIDDGFASPDRRATVTRNISLRAVMTASTHRRALAQIPYQAAQESFTAMPVAIARLRLTPVSSTRMTPSFW